MATITISLSDEEMRRLEGLSKREGLPAEQLVQLAIRDLIGQIDKSFRFAVRRVPEKNIAL